MSDKDLAKAEPVMLIVAGGRDFDDWDMMNEALYRFPDILVTEFVNGMCETGADEMAREYARKRGRKVHEYAAAWGAMGKAAGPMRNQTMASIAHVLIAFWDGRSPGTRDMINKSLKAGLEVHVYRYPTKPKS